MTVDATTAPDTGLRTYRWQGVDYPSVTSIRRIVGMPFALANWQVNQVIKAALDNATTLDSMLAREGNESTGKWLRKAASEERERAADRGKAVHEAASLGLAPTDAGVTSEVSPYLAQFYDFLGRSGAEVLLSERQVWNPSLGYAGTFDLVLRMKQGRRPYQVVVDIKTGKGLYSDHALQLCQYALGEFVGEHDVIDLDATRLLHSCSRLGVLHLSESAWELVEFDPTPELFNAVKNLCGFAHWLIANPNIDALVARRTVS